LKTPPIHFAICGAGHIGMRHAEIITRNPDTLLTAVIDTDIRKEEIVQRLYPKVRFFSNEEAFYSSDLNTDVMVIATPNGFHASQALLAIKKGLHVVIEKPMGLFAEECRDVIQAAETHKKKVFCVMQNRYSPPSQWLKQLIEKGVLGKIYQVNTNCYWNRDSRYYTGDNWHGTDHMDGGTLFTQFSHFVDLILWVFGDITHIQAQFDDFNHANLTHFEDTGNVIFRFVQGGIGSIQYSTALWDKNFESSITVIAENGTIKIGGQYMERVEYCHIKNYSMPDLPPTNPSNQYGKYSGSASNHQYVIQNVVDVLNRDGDITTNAFEGLRVVEIIRRIYQLKTTKKR
jgi:predicted dehydrogenase